MATTLRAILPHLFTLLLGFALLQMGNTLQGTLLSIRGDVEGFASTQIGAVGACFWAGIVAHPCVYSMAVQGSNYQTFIPLVLKNV